MPSGAPAPPLEAGDPAARFRPRQTRDRLAPGRRQPRLDVVVGDDGLSDYRRVARDISEGAPLRASRRDSGTLAPSEVEST